MSFVTTMFPGRVLQYRLVIIFAPTVHTLGVFNFGIAKPAAALRLEVRRMISSLTKKSYSSRRMGCVSTSTVNSFANENIRCKRSGGSNGGREKKKSASR